LRPVQQKMPIVYVIHYNIYDVNSVYLLFCKGLYSYLRSCYIVAHCGAEVVAITSLFDEAPRVYIYTSLLAYNA